MNIWSAVAGSTISAIAVDIAAKENWTKVRSKAGNGKVLETSF